MKISNDFQNQDADDVGHDESMDEDQFSVDDGLHGGDPFYIKYKIPLIVFGVVLAIAIIVGVKSFIGSSSDTKTTPSNSEVMQSTTQSTTKNSHDSTSESNKMSDSSSDISDNNDSESSNVTTSISTEASVGESSSSVVQPDEGSDENDEESVKAHIESLLPTFDMSGSTITVKAKTDVSTKKDESGVVVSTLSSNGTSFAEITTKDGLDSLKLLPGYKEYVYEQVNSK